jgi:hypothetical protein
MESTPARPVAPPPAEAPLDPVAVAALALGLLAVVPGLGVAAVVCGHVALRRWRSATGTGRAMAGAAPGRARGSRGFALAGLVLGYSMTALWMVLAAAVLAGRGG